MKPAEEVSYHRYMVGHRINLAAKRAAQGEPEEAARLIELAQSDLDQMSPLGRQDRPPTDRTGVLMLTDQQEQEFREWQQAERISGLDRSWAAYIALRRIKWAIGGQIIRHAARSA